MRKIVVSILLLIPTYAVAQTTVSISATCSPSACGPLTVQANGFAATGTAAGGVSLSQGSAPSTPAVGLTANSVNFFAPSSVTTAYGIAPSGATPTSGFWYGTLGTGATFGSPTITGGGAISQVTQPTVSGTMTGYLTPPPCYITVPSGSPSPPATCYFNVSGGAITTPVQISSGGGGYTGLSPVVQAAPTLSLSYIAAEGTATKVQLTGTTSNTSNDVVTYDGSGNVQDSGTSLASLAPIASPGLTGTPTAPTPASTDSSTKIATTAFVTSAVYGVRGAYSPASVASVNSFGQWTTPAAITVTSVDLYTGNQSAGCSTAGTYTVYDQTASANVMQVPISNGQNTFTVTGSVNVAAGHILRMRVTTASSGCSTSAGQLVSSVTYQMQ
jgi:hypothetical protein